MLFSHKWHGENAGSFRLEVGLPGFFRVMANAETIIRDESTGTLTFCILDGVRNSFFIFFSLRGGGFGFRRVVLLYFPLFVCFFMCILYASPLCGLFHPWHFCLCRLFFLRKNEG